MGSSGRRPPRAAAIGSRRAAPRAVRQNTNVTGVSSPTAILISKYGTPQITAIAANSTQPRRVTSRARGDVQVDVLRDDILAGVGSSLQSKEPGIAAAESHQLLVGALLDQPAVLEEEDPIRPPNC